ncbi:hypothetical protein XBO1_1160003 [Xenorhabdus bovienii str. oregonense]|uniref:Uncharacterized protein n=1 Tax=Xenorhabdus bovienii str. oregonense TaxID=1398202 RepID=A0A077P0I2_XENBV|nr:hypothetical protein [Xenorhabdus bovienii]CDH04238.1 hypothetical protein XBO1_1160003 [Xenorhabdus bovienii str. oregonense]
MGYSLDFRKRVPAYPESGVEIARRSLNAVKPNHADLRHYWLQLSEV